MNRVKSSKSFLKKPSFFLGGIVGAVVVYGLTFFLGSYFSPENLSPPVFLENSSLELSFAEQDSAKENSFQALDYPQEYAFESWGQKRSRSEILSITPLMKNSSSYIKSNKPSIALVFVGVGCDKNNLEKALKILPKQVSFSFAPYASHVSEWIRETHQKGHEVLLNLPLESFEYPQLNKGSYTLLRGENSSENLSKLAVILEKGGEDIIGLYGFMGSAILTSKHAMAPILKDLKTRGYMLLGTDVPNSVLPGLLENFEVPYVQSDIFLDTTLCKEDIEKNLKTLENIALEKGVAIGIGHLHGITLDVVDAWIATLNVRGFELIPLTSFPFFLTQKGDHGPHRL